MWKRPLVGVVVALLLVVALTVVADDDAQDLAAAREKWPAFQDYDFIDQRFCLSSESPKRVGVRNREIGVIEADGFIQIIYSGDESEYLACLQTIEEMFDMIEDAITQGANTTMVEYDDEYGYPTSIFIDYGENIADEEVSVRVNSLIARPPLQEDLDASRAKWLDFQDYEYVYDEDCECLPVEDDPKLVLVRGGSVSEVTFVETEETYIGDFPPPTIAGLFDEIQAAIDDERSQINIEYNETFGFPASIYIDYLVDVADDEFRVRITDLVPPAGLEAAANALAAALKKWPGFLDYDFEDRRSCANSEVLEDTRRVGVRNGTIGVIEADNAISIIYSGNTSEYQECLQTIEEMFDMIGEAIDGEAFRVLVEYDGQYGYPTVIGIDYDLDEADDEVDVSVTNLRPRPPLQADLDAARAKWPDFDDYDCVHDKACECLPEEDDPKLVRVRSGFISSVTFEETGEEYTGDNPTPTIVELFTEIQTAIDEEFPFVNVTYDETYGFPMSIFIDYAFAIVDEELSLTLSDFVSREGEVFGPTAAPAAGNATESPAAGTPTPPAGAPAGSSSSGRHGVSTMHFALVFTGICIFVF